MASIKAIEGRSVHQIQSGQVIVDLCSVVKELVENSLDAAATSIDVRFKTHGLDSIEVQDNGGGIAPEDYASIALKHTTSKLSTYDDLGSLATFGFRGEALSSMCALSKFHIVTAREDEAPKGKRLDFETSGKLKGTAVAACQKGTIVAVEELFYNMPVRRKDLERNIKREYRKVLDVLQAYACISQGVRLSVSHQPQNGKKAVVFSTKASQATRDNIANIFGAKTLSAIIPLDLELELQPTTSQVLKDFHAQVDGTSRLVKVTGHVSRPVFGEGRSTPDRQMFFVNSRPCGLPQIAKAFNEVYKQYNITQSPFIFANLEMDTHAYDVNVSPDKRTILLHDQNALLESLKESLIKLFDAQDQTVPQSQLQANKLPLFKPPTITRNVDLPLTVEYNASREPSRTRSLKSSLVADSPSRPLAETDSSQLESGEPVHLMQKFIGRNVENREDAVAVHEKSKLAGKSRQLYKSAQGLTDRHDTDDEMEEDEPDLGVHGDDARQPDNTEDLQASQPRATSSNYTADNEGGDPVQLAKGDFDENSLDGENHETENTGAERPSRFIDTTTPAPLRQASVKRSAFDAISAGARSAGTKSHYTPANKRIKIFGKPLSSSLPSQNSQSSQFTQRVHAFAAPGTKPSYAQGTPEAIDGAEDVEAESDVPSDSQQSADGETEQDESDEELIDEDERRRRDEAQVAEMLRKAETQAAKPTQEQEKRAASMLKSSPRKDSTVSLVRFVETSAKRIEDQMLKLKAALEAIQRERAGSPSEDDSSSKVSAEERLSLTISKTDFAQMQIVGQFNLGFILATRPASAPDSATAGRHNDELFIIDQHASDEIYNFHRLSATTTLTPQPLVRPHALELTAIEEETILSHTGTLAKNGFNITVDESGARPVGQRCHLLTLPTSRETVFDTRDLEELISLLSETSPFAGDVVRPSKVRKMLAMRACRSSIMVGKSLTRRGMEGVVRHMGEIDKPWNCPHGRPTMRHLASLGQWSGWGEGDGLVDDEDGESRRETDWAGFVASVKERGLLSRGTAEDANEQDVSVDEGLAQEDIEPDEPDEPASSKHGESEGPETSDDGSDASSDEEDG